MNALLRRAYTIWRRDGLNTLAHRARYYRYKRIPPFTLRLKVRWLKNRVVHGWNSVPHPLRKLYIDPDIINYVGPHFDNAKYIGTIKQGGWDKERALFEEHHIYKGLFERISQKKDWEETVYFQHAKEKIESGGVARGCQTIAELKTSRLSYLDNLVNKIKKEGYKTQNELTKGDRDNNRDGLASKMDLLVNEVGCHISRDGDLLVNSGYHRLAIAKILQLEKIPIQIIVTHNEWQDIRNRFIQTKKAQDIRSVHNHPDLKNILR